MNYSDFTNLYKLSKTLRFELKPVGNTLENIKKKGLLQTDENRAENYKKVKKFIDEYHKVFITKALADAELPEELLQQFSDLCKSKDKNTGSNDVPQKLRKIIVDCFKVKNKDVYDRLKSGKLIKEDLPAFIQNSIECGNSCFTEDDLNIVNSFSDFTTYFSGFNTNRENMYSADEKSTAISYRLINENLPRFIDNINVYDKVKDSISEEIKAVYSLFKVELEELSVPALDEVFTLPYYNKALTQRQIDLYNAIIGGRSKGEVKEQGLNEYINLYNQKNKTNLPKLRPLFKQILSDRESLSWLPENFADDNALVKSINDFYASLCSGLLGESDDANLLKDVLERLKSYNLSGIYLKTADITAISQKLYGNWNFINLAIEFAEAAKGTEKKKSRAKSDSSKKQDDKSYSIGYLQECVDAYNQSLGQEEGSVPCISEYFEKLDIQDGENIFARLRSRYSEAKEVLAKTDYAKGILKNDSEAETVEKIKSFLDAIKDLQSFIKPLKNAAGQAEKDDVFYGEFMPLWEELDAVTPLYDKVRNYLTGKPYSEEKIKLNFENKGNLLGGWVDSCTANSDNGTQYGGYLLRKMNHLGEYDYFLGISSDTKILRSKGGEEDEYERLDYYQLKGNTVYNTKYKDVSQHSYDEDKNLLVKTIKGYVETYGDEQLKNSILSQDGKAPSGLLTDIQKSNPNMYDNLLKYKPFEEVNRLVTHNLHLMLNKCLADCGKEDEIQRYEHEGFTIFTEVQKAIDEVINTNKIYSYRKIKDSEVKELMERDKKTLYLFKISNKDLSYSDAAASGTRKSRGRENLHTMYFKALMSGQQSVFDIGAGTVFYRKASDGVKKGPTHVKDVPVKNKNENNAKEYSYFSYDLIKDRRYTEDKFLFHLSVDINFSKKPNENLNKSVQNCIFNNGVKHIIGIDRGERNLLYLSMIDMDGNIVLQRSLNELGDELKTNYNALLGKRESERMAARKSWKSINGIKELKEGYLSIVIHEIAELMVKYNAIVVLEDLNQGFMRGRQKVEKSVYQKFEKKLIDKLNYLVDKKKGADEVGGLLKAYQLTSPYTTSNRGNQNGFLFYVPAWNTSNIDPVTGFAKLFSNNDLSYSSVANAQAFLKKFDAIRYNSEKGYFEFVFDYKSFKTSVKNEGKTWTVCTYGERIVKFRNPEKNSQWDSKELTLSDEFKKLFEAYNVDYKGSTDLKKAVLEINEKAFFAGNKNMLGLLQLLKLTLQLRNSDAAEEKDYILSPVADANGNFFDSRKADQTMPLDADANGAYNIARKGLWTVQQIRNSKPGSKISSIKNDEWLRYAQG